MDRQYAAAVILVIAGIGLAHAGGGPFHAGLGIGMAAMGAVWVGIRLVREARG